MKKVKSILVSSIGASVIASNITACNNIRNQHQVQKKVNQKGIGYNEYQFSDNKDIAFFNKQVEQIPLLQSTISRLSDAKYPYGIGLINMTNLAIESLKNREFKNYINEFYDHDKNGWAWHIKFVDIQQSSIKYSLVKKSPKIGGWRSPSSETVDVEVNISKQQYNFIFNT